MATELVPEPVQNRSQPEGRVAKNALIYFIGQLLSWAVSFLTVSLIPRYLGETAMGSLGTATVVVSTCVSVFALSIDPYISVEVGRDRNSAERLVRAAWGLRLALFLPLLVTVQIVLWLMHVSAYVHLLSYVGLASAFCVLMYNPMRASLAGLEEAKRVSATDLVACFYPLLALPFLRAGAVALPAANAVIAGLILLSLCLYIRRYIRIAPLVDFTLWRQLAKGGVPFLMNDVVTQLYVFGSIFVLRHFAAEAAVGEYTQALRLQGTFMFIPVALGMALLPSLSRMADNDASEFRRTQNRVVVLMIAMALPVASLVFMLAEPFCHVLYGTEKFRHVPLALQFSAINVIPLYVNTVLYRFLVAQRKNLVWSLFMTVTVSLNALLCLVLVPLTLRYFDNAPAGAFLASLMAECVTVVSAFIVLRNNPLDRETLARVIRALAATAAMVGVLWLTRPMFLLVPTILGVGTFVVLAWFLHILGREEEEKLLGLVRGKLRRG